MVVAAWRIGAKRMNRRTLYRFTRELWKRFDRRDLKRPVGDPPPTPRAGVPCAAVGRCSNGDASPRDKSPIAPQEDVREAAGRLRRDRAGLPSAIVLFTRRQTMWKVAIGTTCGASRRRRIRHDRRRVKDRLGGWQDSETRKQIYQDRQTDELRAEAAKFGVRFDSAPRGRQTRQTRRST